MTTWQIILAIVSVLFVATWATIIPVCVDLWSKLKRLYTDYKAAVADGTITDAEKIEIADDVMQAIPDATNILQFATNLITAIIAIIKNAKLVKKIKAQMSK
jgi:hypothetical protein